MQMKLDDIVKHLRTMASEHEGELRILEPECDGESIQLPLEMVNLIDHGYPESEWSWVKVEKVLRYIADMMEE